jgi:hypothetical protein
MLPASGAALPVSIPATEKPAQAGDTAGSGAGVVQEWLKSVADVADSYWLYMAEWRHIAI